jgi:L-ascorbate metabolism protein UlaG (beta-lactamase superfamily)
VEGRQQRLCQAASPDYAATAGDLAPLRKRKHGYHLVWSFRMSPTSAALAVKRYFKLDVVIPCHYGSFPIIEPNAEKFLAAMKGSRTRVVVPEKGKPVGF